MTGATPSGWRLALAGELSPVRVPPEQVEGLREIAQAMDDLACSREAVCQRVNAIPCRHGVSWDERTPTGRLRKRRGQRHWNWLRSSELGDPGPQAAYLAALAAAEAAEIAHGELRAKAEELAAASELEPAIDALMCVKGAGFSMALAFAAEAVDFSRFPSGRNAMAYFGLASSESSSADARRLERVSKDGCALVRRLLVECA